MKMSGYLHAPVALAAWTLYAREISGIAAWNFPVSTPDLNNETGKT
jgi:hypothetical protein